MMIALENAAAAYAGERRGGDTDAMGPGLHGGMERRD
jgi:hypothetical protein